MLLIYLFFSAWMFFEDNKAKIVRGSGGVVDFSSLFDNAINQKDSFIPFQDSKVSIFWFYFLGCNFCLKTVPVNFVVNTVLIKYCVYYEIYWNSLYLADICLSVYLLNSEQSHLTVVRHVSDSRQIGIKLSKIRHI